MDTFVLRKQEFEPLFSHALVLGSTISFVGLLLVADFSAQSELMMILMGVLGWFGIRNSAFFRNGEYPARLDLGDSMVIASANGKTERISYEDIEAVQPENYKVAGDFLSISLRNGEEKILGIFEEKEHEIVSAIERRLKSVARG